MRFLQCLSEIVAAAQCAELVDGQGPSYICGNRFAEAGKLAIMRFDTVDLHLQGIVELDALGPDDQFVESFTVSGAYRQARIDIVGNKLVVEHDDFRHLPVPRPVGEDCGRPVNPNDDMRQVGRAQPLALRNQLGVAIGQRPKDCGQGCLPPAVFRVYRREFRKGQIRPCCHVVELTNVTQQLHALKQVVSPSPLSTASSSCS